MLKILLLVFLLPLLTFTAQSKDEANYTVFDKLRKLPASKTGKYVEKGTFFKEGPKIPTQLKEIRHFYHDDKKEERIVFEFVGEGVPKCYGPVINVSQKRIYIDFYNTKLGPGEAVKSLGKSKLVEKISFFPLDDSALPVEIHLKEASAVEAFYLDGGKKRLVIDVKL